MTLEPNVKTFGDALWYCFAIVTTIGFGDIVATSMLGRILSVILGIYGLVVVSIITSIIVNFYNEVKSIPDPDESQEKPVSAEPITEQSAEKVPEQTETNPAENPSAENKEEQQ